MQAVEKLRTEMEQNKTDQYVQVVGAFLLQHLEANPGDAEKVLAEGKTVKGSLSFMRDEAKKKQSGNVAVLTPQEGFDIVLKYYGITGAQASFTPAAAPVKPAPKVDFDVSLDDLLADTPDKGGEQACRVCGCTHYTPCDGGCYWVEPDLCSSCAGE